MIDLLFFMILGHFVGDFALQTDRMARGKRESTAILTLHVFLYTLTLAVFIAIGMRYNGTEGFFTLTTLLVLAGVFLIHWLQDLIKGKYFNGSKQAYYLDQAVHVMVIFAARLFVFNG